MPGNLELVERRSEASPEQSNDFFRYVVHTESGSPKVISRAYPEWVMSLHIYLLPGPRQLYRERQFSVGKPRPGIMHESHVSSPAGCSS